MIICHCENITDRDIDAAIDWARAADPDALITPGKIFRALGKSADCGGCLPLFLNQMRANPRFPVPAVDTPGPGGTVPGQRRANSGARSGSGKGKT